MSATYAMQRVGIFPSSARVASSGWTTHVVVQPQPQGGASFCNAGYVASLGFWSLTGAVAVPVELHLEKTANGPTPLLLWSGTADVFEIYRSTQPWDVTAPENLVQEATSCSAGVGGASGSDLLFFNVVPQARETAQTTRQGAGGWSHDD